MNKSRISVSLAQLFIVILLLILMSVGISTLVFQWGLQTGLDLDTQETSPESGIAFVSATPDQALATLPRAMTATPRKKIEEMLTYTNESIAQMLRQRDQTARLPELTQVQEVSITQQGLTLDGTIDGLGFNGPIELIGTPVASGGKLLFQLETVSVDGQVLPQFLYPSLETEINRYFEEWLWGYEVQTIDLSEGQLTLVVISW